MALDVLRERHPEEFPYDLAAGPTPEDLYAKLAEAQTPDELYLNLLKGCLTRAQFPENYRKIMPPKSGMLGVPYVACAALAGVQKLLSVAHLELVRNLEPVKFRRCRAVGLDWPAEAETMVGLARLDNLQFCVTDVLRRNIPGDLVEAGVWRGGASIFMRAILKVYGDTNRKVWAADLFQGLPRPRSHSPLGRIEDELWKVPQLAVPLDDVQANFARYGLLDEQVEFVVGWFSDSLPSAPIQRIAVLRCDADMYDSTMDILNALYQKVSPGGYVIIDEYKIVSGCRDAVDEFRTTHGIADRLHEVDFSAVYWQRSE